MTLSNLNKTIIHCTKCERLVNFREKIAKEKRKQYIDQIYWGKPITCLLYTSPSPRDY